jgi:hypothetical protein
MNNQSDSPQSIVERGYDKVAAEYARLEGDAAWPRMRWLKKLLEQLDSPLVTYHSSPITDTCLTTQFEVKCECKVLER